MNTEEKQEKLAMCLIDGFTWSQTQEDAWWSNTHDNLVRYYEPPKISTPMRAAAEDENRLHRPALVTQAIPLADELGYTEVARRLRRIAKLSSPGSKLLLLCKDRQ